MRKNISISGQQFSFFLVPKPGLFSFPSPSLGTHLPGKPRLPLTGDGPKPGFGRRCVPKLGLGNEETPGLGNEETPINRENKFKCVSPKEKRIK